MDQIQVLETGHEIRSRESALEATLRETIAGFNTSGRREAIRTLLSLHATNPTSFALASIRVLADPVSAKSVGSYYLAGLIGRSDGVIDLLLDIQVLTDEEAVSLAKNIVRVDSFLDVRLTRKLLAGFGGDASVVPTPVGRRSLCIIDAISDCSRITTYLMRLGSHPDLHVRSKAVLLLGRGNLNFNRVELFMTAGDSRTRANAIESLWGQKTAEARALFLQASNDPDRRVAINGLIGLCKAGGTDAGLGLISLLQSEDPLA